MLTRNPAPITERIKINSNIEIEPQPTVFPFII
jgi:hypothetical protein